jgi:F0F1-type ATP synthase epsilon subunit
MFRLDIDGQGVARLFTLSHGFLETTQRTAQIATDTAQTLGAEQQHYDNQNDQQRADTDSTYTHDSHSKRDDAHDVRRCMQKQPAGA